MKSIELSREAQAARASRDVALLARFHADPVAQRIGEVKLPTFSGLTVRQALGISGCLAIADQLRAPEHTSGYVTLLSEIPPPFTIRRNAAEAEWEEVWRRFRS